MRTPAAEVSLFIAMDLDMAMQAALVRTAADVAFFGDKARFRTNPANTLPYAALLALETRSIIHITELVRNPVLGGPEALPGLRQLEELTNYRDAASHPFLLEWRRKEMQQFYAERRHHTHVRAALLWDLNTSINEMLPWESQRNTELRVTVETSLMLSLILRGSLAGAPPTEPETHAMLLEFQPKFLDFVIRRAPPVRSTSATAG